MSNAERQKRYRDSKRNAPVTELPQSVTEARYGVTPDLERNSPKVTPQDTPQSTNGGGVVVEHPPRTRLVAIPGDPDYVGCCKLVAGVWQVDNTKPDVKAMPTDELVRRLHYIKDWQRSPEHQEVLRRRREAVA